MPHLQHADETTTGIHTTNGKHHNAMLSREAGRVVLRGTRAGCGDDPDAVILVIGQGDPVPARCIALQRISEHQSCGYR